MRCAHCGQAILTVPCEWDPVALVAVPLEGIMEMPRRSAALDLYRQAEKKGNQICVGEPYVTLVGGGKIHVRCSTQ